MLSVLWHLGDTGDVLLGNSATLDLAAELETAAGLSRLEVHHDLRKLPASTGLLLVCVVDLRRLADGFTVVHLRTARPGQPRLGE